MKRHILFLLGYFIFLSPALRAQKKVYTIPADSVKITYCDSAELILENHTQNVPGFLFNTGNGRTIFKRGSTKLNDSLYLIGADTLNLGARSWIQGGNQFGSTGVLGTLDNNHLDFYTNGLQRARLTNTGDLNIGVATITSGGNLINTNAVLFNHVVSELHGYQPKDIYISRLDNVLYGFGTRLPTTYTPGPNNSTIVDITFPPSELAYWAPGIVYAGGKICLSYWNGGAPQQVDVQLYDNNQKAWFGPFTSTTNLAIGGAGYFEVDIPGGNWVNEIKITMTPPPGGWLNLQNMEYVLSVDDEGLNFPTPYVSKTGNERLYNSFYFWAPSASTPAACISSYLSNYFLNNVLVGASTDNGSGTRLQVTGGVSSDGNIQFSGLTGNNTLTRVLVSDGSGNLYYRDASTLAATDAIRSSLVVNGPITAKRLTLIQKGWPDYVFKKDYELPTLPSLERYIDQHHHLPGITPAAEAEKKGVDIGENQAALLKKVEELTLYVIQQNKKLDAQDKKIASLSREVKRLSTKSKSK